MNRAMLIAGGRHRICSGSRSTIARWYRIITAWMKRMATTDAFQAEPGAFERAVGLQGFNGVL